LSIFDGEDIPADMLPYKGSNLRKGFTLYMETNLNEKPPSGLSIVILEIVEALAGGPVPDGCEVPEGGDMSALAEECQIGPLKRVFKDCANKEQKARFDMAIPIDGLKLGFAKVCGGRPDGYPVDEENTFRFMTIGLEFEVALMPFSVSISVEVLAEFDLPNGEDKFGRPNTPLTAVAGVRMSITLSITVGRCRLKAVLKRLV
jgi:hypothetical protein